VIALDHDSPVKCKAGEDRQGRVAVEAIGVVQIGNVFARLAEGGDLEIAVDPEGLATEMDMSGLSRGKALAGAVG